MDDYNHRMFALRYAYVLALVVWLGSIVALGAIVAPTTFGVLQSLRPDVGRELAGAVFGTILAVFAHRMRGAATAVQVLRGMVLSLYGFAVFFFVLGEALGRVGLVAAFAASASLPQCLS